MKRHRQPSANRAANQARTRSVVLAGNPNVGKSTIFNALTGMRQHTGNWSGKTVGSARGRYTYRGETVVLTDTPGTYSLNSRSAEEAAAREAVCFSGADAVAVVCGAVSLERNLILALQILEARRGVILCVNMMDEARRRGVTPDLARLSECLGVTAVGVSARDGDGLESLKSAIAEVAADTVTAAPRETAIKYTAPIEDAAARLEEFLRPRLRDPSLSRWAAIRLLEGGEDAEEALSLLSDPHDINTAAEYASQIAAEALARAGGGDAGLRDTITACAVLAAEAVAAECAADIPSAKAYSEKDASARRQARLDRLLTGRLTGIPVMLTALAAVVWITVFGANFISGFLSGIFRSGEPLLRGLMLRAGLPDYVTEAAAAGVYRTLTWVVAVMLPPMAVFFPLFTLLEDLGYLPRVAFNLDRSFSRCGACGKQALTMAMGLGCNAVGVTGCRIIDSPRERLIAILTNSFMPCNGRFPLMITVVSVFMLGAGGGMGTVACALIISGLIVFGVVMTLAASRLLGATVLKGTPSSFILELPPYRKPKIGQVIARSALDRTLFVLGRAAAVAAPAGLLIWLLANVRAGGTPLLALCSGFLDPVGRFIGLDGAMLFAFILGWPANEIVLPAAVMIYTVSGGLTEITGLAEVGAILSGNGWTWTTALCAAIFSMLHWPCSTACLTVYGETRSLKWTAAAVLLPAAAGFITCAAVARIFG